jgi:hypothetical protein
MPEFFSSENTPLPLSKRLSDQFNAKIYPLDYAKTHKKEESHGDFIDSQVDQTMTYAKRYIAPREYKKNRVSFAGEHNREGDDVEQRRISIRFRKWFCVFRITSEGSGPRKSSKYSLLSSPFKTAATLTCTFRNMIKNVQPNITNMG